MSAKGSDATTEALPIAIGTWKRLWPTFSLRVRASYILSFSGKPSITTRVAGPEIDRIL